MAINLKGMVYYQMISSNINSSSFRKFIQSLYEKN